MALEKKVEEKVQATMPHVTDVVDKDPIETIKGFWANYGKKIAIGLGALTLVLGAYIGYKKLYVEPQETKANEAIFAAERLFDAMSMQGNFNADSSKLVLSGDKSKDIIGVLDIVKNYGSTATGDRAKFIAGAVYLHQKDFANATKYLSDFDGNGANQVKSKALIMLAQAYAEQNKKEETLSNFKKAAELVSNDDNAAAEALFLGASYADYTNNSKEAVELFSTIKTKYPSSKRVVGGDVDKYLARLGQTK